MKSGKISGKDFIVSQDAQDKLAQDLAQLLQQAHDIGKVYAMAMIKHQEAVSVGSVGTGIANFLKRAKDLIAGMIGKIRDAVEKVIADNGDPSDAEDAVDHILGYMPDSVAATMIHDEVEETVYEIFAEEGIEYVEWVCEPDSCELCQNNQIVGPIKYGEMFPSEHVRPTAHYGCRCVLVSSEG